MKTAGVSTSELARALGVTYQAVRKVLGGGQFGMENNAAAARRLGVNSDWLATGKGLRSAGAAPDESAPIPEQEYQQLLRDLDVIHPRRRAILIEQIRQVAEDAREAAAHIAAHEGKKSNTGVALSDEERARLEALRRKETVSAPASSKSGTEK
jgi:phage repressor protein C with HTH and peptisase S24 domain